MEILVSDFRLGVNSNSRSEVSKKGFKKGMVLYERFRDNIRDKRLEEKL